LDVSNFYFDIINKFNLYEKYKDTIQRKNIKVNISGSRMVY